jgi:hypothetical protein
MADWWYTKNGERQGPVSSSQLRQLAQAGELLPTDMVFKEGGTEWKLASTVSNLFPSGGGGGIRSERPAREERDSGGMDFDRRDDRDDRRDRDDRDDRDDDDRPSRRRGRASSSSTFVDLLMFRRMIAPMIIMVLFWLGIVGIIGYGLFGAGTAVYFAGARGILIALMALITMPIGILAIRLYAELAILLFRMNETLTEIKNLIEKDQRPKS